MLLLIAAMSNLSRRQRRGVPTRRLRTLNWWRRTTNSTSLQMTGGASDKVEQMAQQQIREREEQGPNLPREGGPILRTRCPSRRSVVRVPLRG